MYRKQGYSCRQVIACTHMGRFLHIPLVRSERLMVSIHHVSPSSYERHRSAYCDHACSHIFIKAIALLLLVQTQKRSLLLVTSIRFSCSAKVKPVPREVAERKRLIARLFHGEGFAERHRGKGEGVYAPESDKRRRRLHPSSLCVRA